MKPGVSDLLRLLIVTGARPDDVHGSKWSMLNLRRGIWNKPSTAARAIPSVK